MSEPIDIVNQQLADDVLDHVHAVMHLARASQYQVLRQAGHGLTHLEGKVLGYFARHPGAVAGDLAAHSGRDKAQLARLLATLKARGYIETGVDAADRRRQPMHLTPAGQALHAAIQHETRHVARRGLAGLSAAEGTQLLALLARLRANLENAEGHSPAE